METKTIISEKFSLQARDFVTGLLMFVLGSVVTFFYELFQAGGNIDEINFETIIKVALSAATTYLFKNWVLEPAKVITTTSSNTNARKAKVMIIDKLN